MTSVADRIAWILAEKKWSARELARRSGLSGTTVSKALEALKSDPDGIVLRTLKAIANGAAVSLAWLATGEGSPYAVPVEEIDPWPQRTAGAALARRESVSHEAIDSVLAEAILPERAQHSAAWWLEFMRLREIELTEHRLAEPPRRARRGEPPPSSDQRPTPNQTGQVPRVAARPK